MGGVRARPLSSAQATAIAIRKMIDCIPIMRKVEEMKRAFHFCSEKKLQNVFDMPA